VETDGGSILETGVNKMPDCEVCERVRVKTYACKVCGKNFCPHCGKTHKNICHDCLAAKKSANSGSAFSKLAGIIPKFGLKKD